jgi:hypothetical protein
MTTRATLSLAPHNVLARDSPKNALLNNMKL